MLKILRVCSHFGYLLLIAVSFGCYEQQDGCLDLNATNYDPSSDNNVKCNYPALSIGFDHQWDEEVFSYDSVYLDKDSNEFEVVFFGFFAMSWEVLNSEEWERLSGVKRNWPIREDGSIEYFDDVIFVESQNFGSKLDSVVNRPQWEKLRTTIAISELKNVNPDRLSGESALSISNQMFDEERGHFNSWVLGFREVDEEEVRWVRSPLETSIEIQWEDQAGIPQGEGGEIFFDIDYSRLFADFLVGLDKGDIQLLIEENIQDAITVRE